MGDPVMESTMGNDLHEGQVRLPTKLMSGLWALAENRASDECMIVRVESENTKYVTTPRTDTDI